MGRWGAVNPHYCWVWGQRNFFWVKKRKAPWPSSCSDGRRKSSGEILRVAPSTGRGEFRAVKGALQVAEDLATVGPPGQAKKGGVRLWRGSGARQHLDRRTKVGLCRSMPMLSWATRKEAERIVVGGETKGNGRASGL